MELCVGHHVIYCHSITIKKGAAFIDYVDECGKTFSVVRTGQTVECPDGKCDMYSLTPMEIDVEE